MPYEERRRTSHHESGHGLLGTLQPGADPVRKITIVPHSRRHPDDRPRRQGGDVPGRPHVGRAPPPPGLPRPPASGDPRPDPLPDGEPDGVRRGRRGVLRRRGAGAAPQGR
ncbi:hypothetical protein AB0L25_06795 [Spirillospora sp. NPDC052242]